MANSVSKIVRIIRLKFVVINPYLYILFSSACISSPSCSCCICSNRCSFTCSYSNGAIYFTLSTSPSTNVSRAVCAYGKNFIFLFLFGVQCSYIRYAFQNDIYILKLEIQNNNRLKAKNTLLCHRCAIYLRLLEYIETRFCLVC